MDANKRRESIYSLMMTPGALHCVVDTDQGIHPHRVVSWCFKCPLCEYRCGLFLDRFAKNEYDGTLEGHLMSDAHTDEEVFGFEIAVLMGDV